MCKVLTSGYSLVLALFFRGSAIDVVDFFFFGSSFLFEVLERLMTPAGCSVLSNPVPTTFCAAVAAAVGVEQLADRPALVATHTELADWPA